MAITAEERARGSRGASRRRMANHPYLVMGPDIHGPTLYYRCRTMRQARIVSETMERFWTIARVVHIAEDLLCEDEHREQSEWITTDAEAKRVRDAHL